MGEAKRYRGTVDGLVWLSLVGLSESNVKLYRQAETLWFPPQTMAWWWPPLELTSERLVIDLLKPPCWLGEMR